MKLPRAVASVLQQDAINFMLTNYLPRRSLSRFVGRFSRIEHPVVRDLSIGALRLFAGDLNLHESKKSCFSSLHDCFTRELRAGTRPVDGAPGVLVSPCDAIVGACGALRGSTLVQAKGHDYYLEELLGDEAAAARYRGGEFVTLRLTSNMYHRFHAPDACSIEGVTWIRGDLFNVNPPALKRVPRLYCRNERVAIHARLESSGDPLVLVAVGAILVGSIQLHFVERPSGDDRVPGPFHGRATFRRGDELGYFHHGSTIIVITTSALTRDEGIRQGSRIQMGQRLLWRR
jgi:phosphatidylserine decarboxylase